MKRGSTEHGSRLDEEQKLGSELAKWFSDTSFPASKEDLLRHAERRHAPDEVAEILHALPDRQYHNIAQAAEALGLGVEKRRW